MRIFKKRILFLDTMVCKESGGRTFTKGFLNMCDKLDIVVDYMTFGAKQDCVDYFESYPAIGEFIPLNMGDSVLQKYRSEYENKKAFYGVYFHNPFTDAMVVNKIHEMLNKRIYDFFFVNHIDNIPAITNYFPFSQFINTSLYTHDGHTFGDTPGFHMGPYEVLATNFNRSCIANDTDIELISQKEVSFIKRNYKNHKQHIIGMPLAVENFHKYFNPEKVEDAVLFLGRFHQKTKNMEGWVRALKKTNLKGVIIVPSKKNKESFEKLLEKEGFSNYEIHYGLSFEEKMRVSAKCKVCYIPSFLEVFPFVAYENFNLMKVVMIDREWSKDFKKVIDGVVLLDEEDVPKTLEQICQEWDPEDIIKQHQFLIDYNKEIESKWMNYFNKEHKFADISKKDTQIIKALKEHKTITESLKSIGRTELDFTEITTLYRNIEWGKVIQTKNESFYDSIIEEEDDLDEW